MEKRVTSWAQENDRLYAKAIETLARYIIEDLDIETIEEYEDCQDDIEDTASYYWREYLDDELKDALEERIAIAKIIDKDCLGGGGWEAKRDIEIDVRKKVKEIIVKEIINH